MHRFRSRLPLLAASTAAFFLISAEATAQSGPAGPPPGREQPDKTTPPPVRPEPSSQPGTTGQSFLERRYGLSREEAHRRLRLEDQVTEAGTKMEAQFGDHLLATIIDHSPNFQVTFVFSRDVPADEVRDLVSADLRPVVKVKRSRYTREQIASRQRRIVDALVDAKLGGSVGYDYRTEKFEVTIPEETEQKLLQALPPDLRSEVRTVRGGVPARLQSGAVAGDSIYGGWMLHLQDVGGAHAECTYGFPVRTHEGQPGITASAVEHCSGPAGIYYDDGHFVTLPAPVVNRYVFNNSGRSYDYRILNTGTLNHGPYTWFWNNKSGSYWRWIYGTGWVQRTWANVNPDYPLEGRYSRLIGVVGGSSGTANTNHPVGATRCKGGFITGITCGQVTLSDAAAVITADGATQTFYGYVKMEGTDYMVLSYGGDSGAPVTTTPVWNSSVGYYEVRAAGILAIGSIRDRGDGHPRPCITPDDGACPAYYMPIDRINDVYPIQVLTVYGGVSPN